MAVDERVPRPASYDGTRGHWEIVQDVRRVLEDNRNGYKRPMEIARELGCTRAEARLALMFWRELKVAGHRESDGRWFYDNAEPWRNPA